MAKKWVGRTLPSSVLSGSCINLSLLHISRLREPIIPCGAVQDGTQTNLGVDLLHTLKVGSGGPFRAEDKVLREMSGNQTQRDFAGRPP